MHRFFFNFSFCFSYLVLLPIDFFYENSSFPTGLDIYRFKKKKKKKISFSDGMQSSFDEYNRITLACHVPLVCKHCKWPSF